MQVWETTLAAGAALLLGLVAGIALRRAPVGRGGHEPDTLRPAGVAPAQTDDAEAAVCGLLDELGRMFGVSIVALTFVSDDGRTAAGALARSRGEDLTWWRDVRLDLEHEPSGIASAVFEATAFALYDVSAGSAVGSRLAQMSSAKSVAHVPVLVDGRVVAVISLSTTDEHRTFSQDELAAMQRLAADGVVALQRLRTAGELRAALEREKLLEAAGRIAAVLGKPLSRRATLEAVAQAAAEALGASSAAVIVPSGGRLESLGSHGLPATLLGFFADRLVEPDGTLARLAELGRVVAAPALADDERLPLRLRAAASEHGYRALLAVSVEAPRDAGGGVVVAFFTESPTFADADVELARRLAEATRGALERSELFEAERSARALAQQLARTGGLLASELDPAAVLEEVVQQAPELVNADAAAIRLLEGDELVVTAAEGAGADDALGSRRPDGAGPAGDVLRSGAPLALPDVGADRRLAALDLMLGAGHSAFLGVPVAGAEGAPVGVLAVYASLPRTWRDDEIEALLALAASTSAALSNAELYQRVALERERSVAILANIADGIVAVDRDGDVVVWNAAAERITGVPAPLALGRPPDDVLNRSLEAPDGAPGDRLVQIVRGREEVWLSVTEAVMRDPAGAVAGRIFAFRDISGDRLVEQVKSDFVSTVSHELRTPLTSIYGFAETLLRRDVLFGDEERQTFLRYIASESQRLTAIVDTLLNVARLDTGDLQVILAETDVRDVVGQALAGVSGPAANGHDVNADLPDEPLPARADPEKLRQVCTILLDNALKYSPAGSTVTVAAARRRDRIEVSVADEGIGISQADREQIFRKFYRGAGAELRTGAEGTGLGLFIARGLVSAMGGRIWVDSREGEGSRFAFELPASGDGSAEWD